MDPPTDGILAGVFGSLVGRTLFNGTLAFALFSVGSTLAGFLIVTLIGFDIAVHATVMSSLMRLMRYELFDTSEIVKHSSLASNER